MPGPVPKKPEQRRRRNKSPEIQKLAATDRPIPLLPGAGVLLETTVSYWETIWRSPMASAWLDADVPGLVRLALLIEQVSLEGPTAMILSEIRQLEDRFGLSPLARRRLQWEIDQAASVDAASNDAAPEDDGRWLRAV